MDKVHTVKATLQSMDLSKANSGITLQVYCEGEKIGNLTIGHGGLHWKVGNNKTLKVSWSNLTSRLKK